MTIADWVARGFSDADARSRSRLQQRVVDGFRQRHRREPVWQWWVPGRVEWFGKHTDYAGGDSLVSAVPRGFIIAAAPRDDDRLVVVDGCDGAQVELHVPQGVPSAAIGSGTTHPWAVYVRAVARRLAANFPEALLGADIVFGSDLPRAAGLSSSSALIVGLSLALIRRGHLEAHPAWPPLLRTSNGLAWYLGCVENGSAWGPLAGEAGVGTHGGSEDHVAILNARPGHVSHYGYVPVRHRGEVPLPAGWTLLVASSGVQAEKTGAAMAGYNRAADAVHRMQAWWNAQAAAPVTSLVDVLAQGDAEGQLRHWMSTQPDGAWLAHRLQHLQREHVRVAQAAQALAGGDIELLGGLAAASQADAEALLGNQIAETSTLVELARGLGAGAASAFGAGYGGSVWALVPTAESPTLAHAWRTAYLRRWPQHEARCEVCVAQPGPGAFALPPVAPT